MEAILILLALVALAILSLRYGADSRDGIRSREHDLAMQGMTWEALAYQQRQLERRASVPAAAEPVGPLCAPLPAR